MELDDILDRINDLEETISDRTLNIAEIERAAEVHNRECAKLLSDWLHRLPKDEEEQNERIEQMMRLNDKEKYLDEKYEEMNKEKDSLTETLQENYISAIKRLHKEREANTRLTKEAEELSNTVDRLSSSSLLSGTTRSSLVDGLNYAVIFKEWQIDKVVVKRSKKGKNRIATYYGNREQKSVYSQDICVKTFSNTSAFDVLVKAYKKMHDMLGHPNLLAPLALIKGSQSIAVELVTNEYASLKDLMDAQQQFGIMMKFQVAKSIALAMSWLHQQSPDYKHLRLKPSNILFTRDWKVKISDYGLPFLNKYIPRDELEKLLFDNQYAHYSAPEIFEKYCNTPPENLASVDLGLQASDLWSFGMILYTLLTNRIPFNSTNNFTELCTRIRENKLSPLPNNIPSLLLTSLIKQCLQSEPSKRGQFSKIPVKDWNDIYQSFESRGNQLAMQIWKQASSGERSIPWSKLANILFPKLKVKIPEGDKRVLCVQLLLGIDTDLPLEKRNSQLVSDRDYLNFVKIFGPLSEEYGIKFFDGILYICQNDWYYGTISRDKCVAILNFAKKDGVKNPFLVRNSVNQEYQFTLSYIIGDKMEHCVLPPSMYSDIGFLAYLKQEVTKKKLRPVPANNIDRLQFSNLFKDKVTILRSESTHVDRHQSGNPAGGLESSYDGKTIIM